MPCREGGRRAPGSYSEGREAVPHTVRGTLAGAGLLVRGCPQHSLPPCPSTPLHSLTPSVSSKQSTIPNPSQFRRRGILPIKFLMSPKDPAHLDTSCPGSHIRLLTPLCITPTAEKKHPEHSVCALCTRYVVLVQLFQLRKSCLSTSLPHVPPGPLRA